MKDLVEQNLAATMMFPMYFYVFKQTVCHLTAEANVKQVFSQTGQLSEVKLDPALADMASIMVNKHACKPSLYDIVDKYYEMFRGKNQSETKTKTSKPSRQSQALGPRLGHRWEN